MTVELLLLCSLIFVFIVSFCGLLQKIKQSYERERIIAARMAERHTRNDRNSDGYANFTFVEDFESGTGIFPGAPPPYSQLLDVPPPKYEDVISLNNDVIIVVEATSPRDDLPRVHACPPPPYTPYTITT